MKFQRRLLSPHSPTYLEMEEYTTPSPSRQSASFSESTGDLSELGSTYSLAAIPKQRSDSLTNLFDMSEDSRSLSNLSIESYTLSVNSYENPCSLNSTNNTTVAPTMVSPQQQQQQQQQQYLGSTNNGSDKISRQHYSSSYKSLTEEQNSPIYNRRYNPNTNTNNNNNNNNNNNSNCSNNPRRGGDSTRHHYYYSANMSGNSSTNSSQKSFKMKTTESVLNTIGINTSSSIDDLTDKCGLIAHDGNDIENNDDDNIIDNKNSQSSNQQHQYEDKHIYSDTNYVESSDENELDLTLSRSTTGVTQSGRGLRKTVLSNVDRLLNSGNKQIKL